MKRYIEMKRFRRKERMEVMQKQKIYHNSDTLRVSKIIVSDTKGKRDTDTEK